MSHNTQHGRRNRIAELLEDDDLTGFDIDSIIMEEFDCSRDAARKARKRLLNAGNKESVNHAEKGSERQPDHCEKNWDTRQYDFYLSGEPFFDIPFDEMQEYVFQYTYAGGGKTRAQICRLAYTKFQRKLTSDYIRRIFACIDVYKSSVPLAPHMYQENTQEELADTWRERDEAGVEARYRSDEMRHVKSMLRRKVKELNSIRDFTIACIEESEFSGLPELEYTYSKPPAVIRGATSVGDILLSDWHYGLKVDASYNRFSPEICRLRVEELLDKLADFQSRHGSRFKEFYAQLLGDMIDGIHGDMHPDQHLEQEIRGVRQVVEASDLQAAALLGLHKIFGKKLTTVKAEPGNHGRDGKGRKDDPQRTPETLGYHLAKAKLESMGVQLDWDIAEDSPAIEFVRDGRLFVVGHGDKSPKVARKIAWPRLRKGMHIVFYSGHLHEVQLSGVFDANFTWVQNGSVCGSTGYSYDELGYHSQPAQVLVECTPDGVLPRPFFLMDHGTEQL